jgi:hypothetical protein
MRCRQTSSGALMFSDHQKARWSVSSSQVTGETNAGGCEPPTSSDRRSGAIARRSAMLLSGTAAIALSIAQPASAISINDQVAAAAGGIANYYDAGNQFPNVVSLVNAAGSFCTGSLINSRTILTASHCFAPNEAFPYRSRPLPVKCWSGGERSAFKLSSWLLIALGLLRWRQYWAPLPWPFPRTSLYIGLPVGHAHNQ